MNYLRSLPVDILKVDRGFIRGLAEGSEYARFALAIIRLGTWLRLTTVAEGIESEGGWSVLSTLGCDCGQGYYLARPSTPRTRPPSSTASISSGDRRRHLRTGEHPVRTDDEPPPSSVGTRLALQL